MDITIKYTPIDCFHCQFVFAVPATTDKKWRETHQLFYCPSCRGQMYYPGESDSEKLQKKMNQYKELYEDKLSCCMELQEEVDHKDRRINGYKGALAKEKKRASAND
ncbi:MAG: hypothetical protein AB2801_08655 [Candidatus Thiodiazotropha endolucinida]